MASTISAHSVSNAYLTMTVVPKDPVLHAQWDIALRDLDFVLGIDRDGFGKLTWAELKSAAAEVTRYAYSRIVISAAGSVCKIEPGSLQVDDHSDGAYAVLLFDIRCGARPPPALSVDYRLFFDVDPSHRGIFVLRKADLVSSALFSPDNQRIDLKL